MNEINFDEWQKLNIKVGTIVEVERVPKTDKLYKLQVNIGEEKNVQVVSGLVQYYTEDELKNKRILILTNLKPVKLAGELSEGMLLCAEDKENNNVVLLSTDKDINNGSIIT